MRLEFRFDDSQARFSDEFIVFDECSEEVVIGAKTMQPRQFGAAPGGDPSLPLVAQG